MEAIKYQPDMVISEPCLVEGMPMEIYHGNPCDGHSASSSGLRTLATKTPAHYYATSYLNPMRQDESDKTHFNLGKAAHTLLLGEGGFRDQYVIRPDEWKDWRTNAAKAWRDEMIELGKTVLVPDDIETIRRVAENLADHPLIRAGILRGAVERSLFFKHEETSVWLKSRPDIVPDSAGILVDLKTTADASPDKVAYSVTDYGYHAQLALASQAMEQVCGVTIDACVLVFVETKEPHCVTVIEIPAEDMDRGAHLIEIGVKRFKECLDRGHWPARYSDDALNIGLTGWARQKFDNIQQGQAA